MNRVAIAYSSKDRCDLTRQTIQPLLQPDQFDLFWCDGSQTDEGKGLFGAIDNPSIFKHEAYGGSCRTIVYALTRMLEAPLRFDEGLTAEYDFREYDYVGLIESDILLEPDWFVPTMNLFAIGDAQGLNVGAVSARNFEDRVLIQRDGYSVNHNLGAGCIIFKREAAELILQQYRTGMTGENRKVFSMRSGIDIGSYWAFRGAEHMLVADWTWDWMLAQHGMCSLALTPSKAMHLENLEKMGLKLVTEPLEHLRNDAAFEMFRDTTAQLPTTPNGFQCHNGEWTIFPHQIPMIGGSYTPDWKFKWSLGFGCFAWKSEEFSGIRIPVLGSLEILISGGEKGGRVLIEDENGFSIRPELQPEATTGTLMCIIPGGNYSYRTVRITALTAGVVFYGIRTREAQPVLPDVRFNFESLPPL